MDTVARPTRRRAVAAYDNDSDAQRAVDRLSDRGFPVDRVAVVGHGLEYVEQVTGRFTTARAALVGARLHAATGGTRDFTSLPGLQAERNEVMVDEAFAARAAELLRSGA
jgi:hypothetical protein